MFTPPAITSDLADARRRELYAAAARGHQRRACRQGRARSVRAAARASGRGLLRGFPLTLREGIR